jgi:hypothetical protein
VGILALLTGQGHLLLADKALSIQPHVLQKAVAVGKIIQQELLVVLAAQEMAAVMEEMAASEMLVRADPEVAVALEVTLEMVALGAKVIRLMYFQAAQTAAAVVVVVEGGVIRQTLLEQTGEGHVLVGLVLMARVRRQRLDLFPAEMAA